MEDTLNNSNDLFLTFRKEMEEMSKKTKRLEKENLTLTRKHALTNRNILEMAEERPRQNKEMEALRKKCTTLETTIRLMQDQGRAPAGANVLEESDDADGSEYEDDEDYEEDSQEGEEYDEETEDDQEMHAQLPNGGLAPTYGPVPPPPPSAQKVNRNEVNGVNKKTVIT